MLLPEFSLPMNRPFLSSLVPLFQSESKCKTILMKMTLICKKMKLHAEFIFIWKVLHLDSFWNRGRRKLGNGLLAHLIVESLHLRCSYWFFCYCLNCATLLATCIVKQLAQHLHSSLGPFPREDPLCDKSFWFTFANWFGYVAALLKSPENLIDHFISEGISLNPWPLDLKSGPLTTLPHCLLRWALFIINRQFPSSLVPLFPNKSKC